MRHQRPGPEHSLSSEKGSWKKSWTGRLPVGLIFPNAYRVGMSNLGFQLVYDMLNCLDEVVCERLFLPADGEMALSVESSRPITDFPILLVSLSFEKDIISLLSMLLAGNIEPLAEKRAGLPVKPVSPLIIAGGVACSINPEPLAPFVDLMVIGEADPPLTQIMSRLIREGLPGDRSSVLAEFGRKIVGCYVPAFYEYFYTAHRKLEKIVARQGLPARIAVSRSENKEVAVCSKIVTPAAEFSDLFLVELGRGCSRGCRFCAAGYVYRPPRLRSLASVLEALHERPEGITKVGLLGMEMAKAEDLAQIVDTLLAQGCRLSFSSLRADTLNDSLIRLLADSNLKTVALAPDGGSERLRKVINKGITREDILGSAEKLVRAGVVNLKLYFMIGLPTETEEDLLEMVTLVREVLGVMSGPGRERGRLSTLTLSINPFVPKAWTPFQFHPFATIEQLKNKMKFLRQNLVGVANLKIMGEKPDSAFLQAVIARGDRRLAPALIELAKSGANWRHVFRQNDITTDDYVGCDRGEGEIFPWTIIDHRIKPGYLWREYQRALGEKMTAPCDTSRCKKCGCCS
ncbi:MAG: radical SAM protein [Proteobacteria bacterium]|nr:radical SAM protein [Pseudomonadota bacterium]MBU1738967.1 radical SAM protein [Pseudomonadota bacterium]